MARNVEKEGLVILLDVGMSMSTRIQTSSYLQTCVDIIQMIVQRKMFASSKDELALVLFGTRETANELWDGNSDHFTHVTMARPLSIVDWQLLEFIQNNINVSNLQGDLIDGVVVASNHFHETPNKSKVFKDKRIIILSDFSASTEDDGDLKKLCKGLSKHEIRVDVISPFSDFTESENAEKDTKPTTSRDASNENEIRPPNESNQAKLMTNDQRRTREILRQICETTEGAMYSFEEVLGLLSTYQAKHVKSSGTKYLMKIGDNFKLPVVSMIKCKENKPDLFKFKKVYAKDETVELKSERARFTKDEEQRDLDERSEVVDAYRYGSTYVPIDDVESLKLKVEKCFDVLGFTNRSNIQRHYFVSEGCQQVMPDPNAGEEVQAAFLSMVHSMLSENVCGLVRRVFSSRSSPELAALIPYVSEGVTCLYYLALPFEDDMRRFTLENFVVQKQFKASSEQMEAVDELIESMDLTKKGHNNDDDDDELYDPHTTFNPYIQRMFQSIAMRATNPSDDLPDFDNHITTTHLTNIGARIRNESTLNILKRCSNLFPTKSLVKKQKAGDSNIFETQKKTENIENEDDFLAKADNLNDLLLDNKKSVNKVKKIGTASPVTDFHSMISQLASDDHEAFEDLCLKLQSLTREILLESLTQSANDVDLEVVKVFQEKVAACIRVQREYCVQKQRSDLFNMYLKAFKRFLINEALNKMNSGPMKTFWRVYFVEANLTLINSSDYEECDVITSEAHAFVETFIDDEADDAGANDMKANESKEEEVEDLLDLM